MENKQRSKLDPPPRPEKRQRRRWIRSGLRWGFWCCMLVAIVLLSFVWYFENRGLPEFVKTRILNNLREKGLEIDFDSMRWIPSQGVLVENATLVAPDNPNEPSFSAATIQVSMQPLQWLFDDFNIEEAILRGGRLTLPVESEMDDVESFEAVGIATRLKLHSRQWWELDYLHAEMLGLEVTFSGSVTNAFAFSEWSTGKRSEDTPRKFGQLIRQIVETKQRIQFSKPPEIKVHVDLDARNPEKSAAHVSIHSDQIQTKWANVQGALLDAEIPPQEAEGDVWDLEWKLSWDQATAPSDWEIKGDLAGTAQLVTRSGKFKNARFAGNIEANQSGKLEMEPLLVTGRISAPETDDMPWKAQASLISNEVAWQQEPAIALASSEWRIQLDWQPDNPQQWAGDVFVDLQGVESPWASVTRLTTQSRIAPNPDSEEASTNEGWAWWAALKPYVIGLDATVEGIGGPWVEASRFETQVQWEAPALNIGQIKGELYRGHVDAKGSLNVPSRQVKLDVVSDFDAREIRHLLSENGKKWIDQYNWVDPPRLIAKGSAQLPAWTDEQPDWRGEVKPTLNIDGHFDVDAGAFRGVPVDGASSDIFFADMIWRLPNLTIHRPEGITRLGYECDARTQDYVWDVDSVAQPKALNPMLNAAGQKVLSQMEFPDPIEVKGKVWGRWHHLERTGAEATLKTGRMSYRDQPCLSVEAQGSFTNQFFKVFKPIVRREEGEVTADALGIHAGQGFIEITNAVSHVHPMAIAHAIGPATARTLEPYRFSQAPKVTMNGKIPFDDIDSVTAQFDVDGGPFSFWKFNVPTIKSRIVWDHEKLTLHDVHAPFYGGTLDGEMRLFLHDGGGAAFEMDADVEDIQLLPFMKDVVAETKDSEGQLSGKLRITSAETGDWGSWNGYGNVHLRNGRLWDTPLFGIFSKLINAVSPGLGNSRATRGDADFTITNSLIETDNMEIRERTARLQYRGSVDFDANLDSRVEAELLRDTPMLGKVFSLALWPVSKLFEYRVTGTIGEPEIKPLYFVPKYLLVPFQSLNNMNDWLLSENGLIPVQRLWRNKEEQAEDEPQKQEESTQNEEIDPSDGKIP